MIRIGIDIDGTTSDILDAIVRNLKSRYNIDVDRNDITSYDIRNCLHINDEVEMFNDPKFYTDHTTNIGADRVISALYQLGYYICFVTNRPSSYGMFKVTDNWLSRNFIRYSDIIFTACKSEVAKEEELSVFVEDKLETALELSRVCETVFLYNAPYNQEGAQLPDNVIRVNDWNEILYILEGA